MPPGIYSTRSRVYRPWLKPTINEKAPGWIELLADYGILRFAPKSLWQRPVRRRPICRLRPVQMPTPVNASRRFFKINGGVKALAHGQVDLRGSAENHSK